MSASRTGSFSCTTVGIAVTPYDSTTDTLATVINRGVTAGAVWLGFSQVASQTQDQSGIGAGISIPSGAAIDLGCQAGELIWAATASGTQTIDVVVVSAPPTGAP